MYLPITALFDGAFLIDENERFIAHNFTGKYLDCGTMNGFIKSNIEISKL